MLLLLLLLAVRRTLSAAACPSDAVAPQDDWQVHANCRHTDRQLKGVSQSVGMRSGGPNGVDPESM